MSLPELDDLSALVSTTSAARDEAERMHAEASRAAAEVHTGPLGTELRDARKAVAEAEHAYRAKPSTDAGRMVLAARERVALAELAHDPAQDAAARRLQGATATLEEAVRAHEAAKEAAARGARIAELLDKAERKTLHDATRPHWERIHQAMVAIEDSATAIEAALKDSHAASAELATMGIESAPPLDAVHASMPMIEHEVAAGRGYALNDHHFSRLFVWPFQTSGKGERFPSLIFDIVKSIAHERPRDGSTPAMIEWAQEKLATFKATRTWSQAASLQHKLAKDREAQRAEEDAARPMKDRPRFTRVP